MRAEVDECDFGRTAQVRVVAYVLELADCRLLYEEAILFVLIPRLLCFAEPDKARSDLR